MSQLNRSIPLLFAYTFGALALLGLLFVPVIAQILTSWVGFLAAVALLIGIVNLVSVHSRRIRKGNAFSAVLVVSVLLVWVLGLTDFVEITSGGVSSVFQYVQAPLEAAMASMLVFFLLFSCIRMLQRERNIWTYLFIFSVILFLLGRTPLPGLPGDIFVALNDFVSAVFVSAGMRGILIGISLGVIAVALRVLMGTNRPYEK